jgi:hypothetical protein
MQTGSGLPLAISAFVVYILGGVSTFGGIALAFFGKGHDILGWGDGQGIGYLFICIGLCASVLGVLLMRIFRNRKLV